MLFVLTQRVSFILTLAVMTVAVWWYLADYYLVQALPDWYSKLVGPEWVDAFSTLVPSALLLTAFARITRHQISKGLHQGEAEMPRRELSPLRNDRLRAMLLLLVPRYQGITQRYIYWLQGNLAGPRPWLCASWILVLWIFLASPPLHGYLMERIATFIKRTPPYFCCVPHELLRAPDEIFNVRNRVRDLENPGFTYRLDQAAGSRDWYMPPEAKADTSVKESGTLLVYAGDFPHLHRGIEVHCSLPDCGFPGLPLKTEELVPVRAGQAEFEFVQSPRGTHLNVELVLLTHSGSSLDWAVVEPKANRTDPR